MVTKSQPSPLSQFHRAVVVAPARAAARASAEWAPSMETCLDALSKISIVVMVVVAAILAGWYLAGKPPIAEFCNSKKGTWVYDVCALLGLVEAPTCKGIGGLGIGVMGDPDGAAGQACTETLELGAGESCDVKCKAGYVFKKGAFQCPGEAATGTDVTRGLTCTPSLPPDLSHCANDPERATANPESCFPNYVRTEAGIGRGCWEDEMICFNERHTYSPDTTANFNEISSSLQCTASHSTPASAPSRLSPDASDDTCPAAVLEVTEKCEQDSAANAATCDAASDFSTSHGTTVRTAAEAGCDAEGCVYTPYVPPCADGCTLALEYKRDIIGGLNGCGDLTSCPPLRRQDGRQWNIDDITYFKVFDVSDGGKQVEYQIRCGTGPGEACAVNDACAAVDLSVANPEAACATAGVCEYVAADGTTAQQCISPGYSTANIEDKRINFWSWQQLEWNKVLEARADTRSRLQTQNTNILTDIKCRVGDEGYHQCPVGTSTETHRRHITEADNIDAEVIGTCSAPAGSDAALIQACDEVVLTATSPSSDCTGVAGCVYNSPLIVMPEPETGIDNLATLRAALPCCLKKVDEEGTAADGPFDRRPFCDVNRSLWNTIHGDGEFCPTSPLPVESGDIVGRCPVRAFGSLFCKEAATQSECERYRIIGDTSRGGVSPTCIPDPTWSGPAPDCDSAFPTSDGGGGTCHKADGSTADGCLYSESACEWFDLKDCDTSTTDPYEGCKPANCTTSTTNPYPGCNIATCTGPDDPYPDCLVPDFSEPVPPDEDAATDAAPGVQQNMWWAVTSLEPSLWEGGHAPWSRTRCYGDEAPSFATALAAEAAARNADSPFPDSVGECCAVGTPTINSAGLMVADSFTAPEFAELQLLEGSDREELGPSINTPYTKLDYCWTHGGAGDGGARRSLAAHGASYCISNPDDSNCPETRKDVCEGTATGVDGNRQSGRCFWKE